MPNIYARAKALNNIKGRINYISSAERQEHLVATFDSADDLQFWSELAAHCRTMAAEAGHKTTCEGREWHASLPKVYAKMFKGREEELAKDISEMFKEKTGTENIVAIHWNKKKTNFHFHVICSENKEINEIVYGAVLTRNTYYDVAGKRSTKKECLDEDGNLKKGCKFYKKGERIQKIKRFGTKENLRDYRLTNEIKQMLADKYNRELKTNQYQVYKEDGMHLKTQKVGNDKPENIRHDIQHKNEVIMDYNSAVDDLLHVASEMGKEQYESEVESLKEKRNEIKQQRRTKSWLGAIKLRTQLIRKHIDELVESMKSNSVEDIITDTIRNLDQECTEVTSAIRNDAEVLQNALEELKAARQQLDVLNKNLAKCKFWESEKKRLLREQITSESERCETAFKTAVSFGCSAFQDGVEMTGTTVRLEGFLYFSEHVIKKLQKEYDAATKKGQSVAEKIKDGRERAENQTIDKSREVKYVR